MEQWWNDTDIGNLKYWERKIKSVGGREINVCVAMVE